MIVIIDYGVGNLASISNILKKVGVEAVVSKEEEIINNASHIILPGVGSFDTCAKRLKESGTLASLSERVLIDKVPVLGVCVGMQLLFEGSDEGVLTGLGWIKGRVIKFDQNRLPSEKKIPHMGWTNVMHSKSSKLLNGLKDDSRFYFVHSYHPSLADNSDSLLTAEYGYQFVAGVERANVMGVQFHPEKSHRYGMQLLANFSKY